VKYYSGNRRRRREGGVEGEKEKEEHRKEEGKGRGMRGRKKRQIYCVVRERCYQSLIRWTEVAEATGQSLGVNVLIQGLPTGLPGGPMPW